MNEPDRHEDLGAARHWRWFATALLFAALAAQAVAQPATPPVIYPAKGQSAQQQDQDRYECHSWARAQSGGYDPTQPTPAMPTQTTAQAPVATANSQGAPVSGMAAGAMGGAAIAELTDHNAGRGAATGALGGALIQRVKQSQAAQQQQAIQQTAQQASQQQAMQQISARSQQRATYERAMSACMEGRGYTVK